MNVNVRDDRGGNRDGRDERTAEAAQKEDNHHHGQQGASKQLALRLVETGGHEPRQVLGDGQLVAWRQILLQVLQSLFHLRGDRQHVAARLASHQQRNRSLDR